MKFAIPEYLSKSSGIYIIRNTINTRFYIGSAEMLYRRYQNHKWGLNGGYHVNSHLQRFVDKYGIETLSFELLELSSKECLIECEQKWIDSLDVINHGFNLNPNAGRRGGHKHTPETRLRLSEYRKQNPLSQESCKKISESNKGRIISPETRLRISKGAKGRIQTPETREKISKGLKARTDSEKEVWRKAAANARAAKIGKPVSEETRRKMSEARKGRVFSENTKNKISAAHIGRVRTDEHKAKMSAGWAARRRPDINCIICDTLFFPKKVTSKCCSRECYYKSQKGRVAA